MLLKAKKLKLKFGPHGVKLTEMVKGTITERHTWLLLGVESVTVQTWRNLDWSNLFVIFEVSAFSKRALSPLGLLYLAK
tara:strand:+ start:118 stop:354 length:237 start_codon:yes stop_codon:yes gene_type:complete